MIFGERIRVKVGKTWTVCTLCTRDGYLPPTRVTVGRSGALLPLAEFGAVAARSFRKLPGRERFIAVEPVKRSPVTAVGLELVRTSRRREETFGSLQELRRLGSSCPDNCETWCASTETESSHVREGWRCAQVRRQLQHVKLVWRSPKGRVNTPLSNAGGHRLMEVLEGKRRRNRID